MSFRPVLNLPCPKPVRPPVMRDVKVGIFYLTPTCPITNTEKHGIFIMSPLSNLGAPHFRASFRAAFW